jgi:DNA-binding response OmpR family regulator
VSRRILLVDDEPAILLTMSAILEMNGFDVVTASSAAEAKLRLEADTYHLVITDLKMENDTSGFEVVRFAKERQYRPATAILTAHPFLGSEWKAKGADCLFVKPANMPELLEGIDALLARDQITKGHEEKSSIAKGIQLPETTASQLAGGRTLPRK